MADVLHNCVRPRQQLTREQKVDIAVFVAHLWLRVPAFHKQIAAFMKQIAETVMYLNYSHPEAFPDLKASYERHTGKKLPDDFGPEHLDPSRYTIEPSMKLALGAALSCINDLAAILAEMEWIFFSTNPRDPFITSDRPFCVLNPKLQAGLYGPGLAQQDIEVTVPMSSTVALFASWGPGTPMYADAKPQIIETVNKRVLGFADELVVASQRSFRGDGLVPTWASRRAPGECGGQR